MSPQPEPDQADDAITPIATLSGAASVLIADPRFQAVGRWIEAYLAGEQPGDPYAYVAGIENRPGRSARKEAAIETRNRALRQLGEAAYPDLAVKDQAQRLSDELRRYFTSTWLPRDQVKVRNPYPPGSSRSAFYSALRAHGRPVGAKQMQRILAGT
jgi:hypothetical protein